jgi:CO dehydrogenase maturation factor
MKTALVGKGGSGKTTVAALFARYLAAAPDRPPLLAVDADINQHLAVALGADEDHAAQLPPLSEHLPAIKEHLRGDNPRISSTDAMMKTTPPGRGSRLLRLGDDDPIQSRLVREVGGVPLAVTGEFAEEDLGSACYHSKVGAVELILNHLHDGPGEYVVVDMTAGADAFASGLFTRFDLTFLVCEPTVRSVGVYRQYTRYAAEFGVRVAVVGNKVEDDADVDFLREHVGSDLLTWFHRSGLVRAAERGQHRDLATLEPENLTALRTMRTELDACERDWDRYQELAVEFHRRNAVAWANERAGEDLTRQVDPGFRLGSPAAATAGV